MDKLFLPEDIDSFLTAVFANAAMVEIAPAGAWPLRNIAHKAALPNAALLRAVISGRLKKVWKLCGVSGLQAVYLDLDEVPDAFESPPLIGLTRDDLRRQLHINCSTVSLLLKSGMIVRQQFPDPRTRQPLSLIAAEELDRFLNLHLPLGLMAWQLGMQAKHVAAPAGQGRGLANPSARALQHDLFARRSRPGHRDLIHEIAQNEPPRSVRRGFPVRAKTTPKSAKSAVEIDSSVV
ncbi:hypothetical protein [Paracoccus pacificus]|uniref:Helix-turn-helix domain-containing protein n=1 Tax=Paracoccus pacificus TaxID=1463598 RepID=A0ABW4R3F5_9RHOB